MRSARYGSLFQQIHTRLATGLKPARPWGSLHFLLLSFRCYGGDTQKEGFLICVSISHPHAYQFQKLFSEGDDLHKGHISGEIRREGEVREWGCIINFDDNVGNGDP
jgi:hypothetical protein